MPNTATTMNTGEPDATEIGHVRFGKRPSKKDLATGTSPTAHFTARVVRTGGRWKRTCLGRHLASGLPVLDITAARWGLTGAETILKLRALRSNGDFHDYWHYHLTQEQRRIHETHYRNGIIPQAEQLAAREAPESNVRTVAPAPSTIMTSTFAAADRQYGTYTVSSWPSPLGLKYRW
jgi:hypothetical protein